MSIAITLSGIALASLAAAFGVTVVAVGIAEIVKKRDNGTP